MNRMSFLLALALPSLLVCLPACAQVNAPATPALPALDQILAKHIEARGGLARIKAIRSLRSVGKVHLGPMVMDLRIENTRQAFRADTSIQGMTKTEAFDGVKGWIIDPFTGKGPTAGPEPMSPDQIKQMAQRMDFDGPLVDMAAKGHSVALMGVENVHGSSVYALKVRLKNGDELLSFLDTNTLLEVQTLSKAVSQGKVVELETTLGDYRPVDGVLLPFSIVIRSRGQSQGLEILLDQVEANTPMDESRFAWGGKGL